MGDRGFVSWTGAKRQFFVGLKDRLEQELENKGNGSTADQFLHDLCPALLHVRCSVW